MVLFRCGGAPAANPRRRCKKLAATGEVAIPLVASTADAVARLARCRRQLPEAVGRQRSGVAEGGIPSDLAVFAVICRESIANPILHRDPAPASRRDFGMKVACDYGNFTTAVSLDTPHLALGGGKLRRNITAGARRFRDARRRTRS